MITRIFCIILLGFVLTTQAPAQEDPGEIRFRECLNILDTLGVEPAKRAFLKMAAEFQGTTWGAVGLGNAALHGDSPAERIIYYQRLATEYAGTEHEIQGRLGVIDLRFLDNVSARMAARDDLLNELGGPRIAEVLAGGSEARSTSIQNLPRKVQKELYVVYYDTWLDLAQMQGQYGSALPVAVFIRDTFDPTGVSGGSSTSEIARCLNGGVTVSRPTRWINPNVSVQTPSEGATVAPTSTLTAQIVVGDVTYHQIDLSKLEILLDGQDAKTYTSIRSQIGTLEPGQPFETLTLTTTPLTPLTVGAHTLTLVVPTIEYAGQGAGKTSVVRNFRVGTSPPPPPTGQTLQVVKDALVYEKSPHSNEGANTKLTLEKITGKASRNLLGFNLSGINAATVGKATLVLTIDPSDQATGWGNGDTVNVKPVTVAWQEGNGKSYGLSSSQQTAGSGSGTTWFSPTDDNISNNSSNSVTQWNGGATYATTGTAPPLTVQNHQTGELRFNVTADVRAGALQGWLLRKDAENKGSKITFYSKEGAAAAGNPALAPRLILEFGSTTTRAPVKSWLAIVLDLMEQGYLQLQAHRTPPALSWLGRAIN